jgi:hypothetical protein
MTNLIPSWACVQACNGTLAQHAVDLRRNVTPWLRVACVAVLVIAAISGCAPKRAPMAEWQCHGWRTVVPGVNECMEVGHE